MISNAGGTNPHSCAKALQNVAKEADIELKIAVVTGDDLMEDPSLVRDAKVTDMDTGQPLPEVVHSMNAYFG